MLSDTEILKYLKEGEIVIEPFDRNSLGPNSYDLHLDDVAKVPVSSSAVDITKGNIEYDIVKLPYCIPPGGAIIAQTKEIVGCRRKTVGILSERSNLARLPLIFSYSKLLDTGFIGKLSCAIINPNPFPVVIHPNYRFLQIMFFHVEGEVMIPYDKRKSSKNLSQFSINDIVFKPDVEWRQ